MSTTPSPVAMAEYGCHLHTPARRVASSHGSQSLMLSLSLRHRVVSHTRPLGGQRGWNSSKLSWRNCTARGWSASCAHAVLWAQSKDAWTRLGCWASSSRSLQTWAMAPTQPSTTCTCRLVLRALTHVTLGVLPTLAGAQRGASLQSAYWRGVCRAMRRSLSMTHHQRSTALEEPARLCRCSHLLVWARGSLNSCGNCCAVQVVRRHQGRLTTVPLERTQRTVRSGEFHARNPEPASPPHRGR
mmetsp:Transcript_112938/g.224830  ORF Transcript_112938/g.224830 Transcript_112938/m.224830 type:complete len:243 (-) Transcript_112938:558-1286(-)